MDDAQQGGSGLVDGEQFMRFSEALKDAFAKLGAAELGESSRQRWQRRLIAITNVAKHDLDRAERQYERFRVDFDRELRGSGARDGAADGDVEDR